MMSATDFDNRLRHIEEQYAAKREGAEAYRDQEMARLFEECEWTQEKIARHMGKKQAWVSYRLTFGRFLKFITGCDNSGTVASSLTEGRFRERYKAACRAFPGKHQSEEKERQRFAHVLNALQHGIPQGYAALSKKPPVKKHTLAVLDDGKWYTVAQIVATVGESLLGVTADQVQNAIRTLKKSPPAGRRIEAKSIGKQSQYRLVKENPNRGPASAAVNAESRPDAVLSLYERAAPLIDELDQIGRMHEACMSPVAVRMVAAKLRRLFDAVLEAAAV